VHRSPEGPAFIPRPKRVLVLVHFVLYLSLFRLLLAIYIVERNVDCRVKISELHVFLIRPDVNTQGFSKSIMNTVMIV
jgi:hypothetical protein